MAKKLEKPSSNRAVNSGLKIHEEVYCGCNNLRCAGICRKSHLVKGAGKGFCTAASNRTNNRDKRVRIAQPKPDVYDNWQDWV